MECIYLFFQVVFDNFLFLFQIAIISAIEGITEFLPISSTAHILIVSKFLNFEITMDFLVGIQSGAILAVVFLYFQDVKKIAKEFLTLKFNIAGKFAIITLPTCIAGFLLSKLNYLEFLPPFTMHCALILGGVVMLFFQKTTGSVEKMEEITHLQCLLIGIFQAVALVPGVSRSASVIIGGLVCKLSKKCAVEVSLLSGIPIIAIASVYETLRSFQAGKSFGHFGSILLGFVFSFLFACLGIWILKKLVKMNIDFKFFGIYRIIIGFALFAIM